MATPSISNNLLSTPTLLASQQLASGATDVYIAPGGRAVQIASAALCNTSGSAVNVTVAVVPSGGSADGTHTVVSAYSLAAGDTISQEDGLSMLKGVLLGQGDKISVTAGTGAAVDCVLTGLVYG